MYWILLYKNPFSYTKLNLTTSNFFSFKVDEMELCSDFSL